MVIVVVAAAADVDVAVALVIYLSKRQPLLQIMNSLLEQWHLHLGHQSIHTSISTELLLQKNLARKGRLIGAVTLI
jgi:hypothetical protein